MIFGRRVNKFYIRYGIYFLLGIAALIFVDIYQLKIPEITGLIVDGIKDKTLTLELLSDYMLNILIIVAIMFTGRFLWRVTIFGNGVRIEADLRDEMFDHSLGYPKDIIQKIKLVQLWLYIQMTYIQLEWHLVWGL